MSRGRDEMEDEAAEEATLGLGDAIAIVLRRARLIVAATLIVGTAAAATTLFLPDRYEAAATVQVDPRQKKLLNIDGVLSDLRTDNPTMSSEVEIIQSRSTLLRVIEQLDLRSDPEFARGSPIQALLLKLGLARPATASAATRPDNVATPAAGATGSPATAARWPDWIGNGLVFADPTRDRVAAAIASRLQVRRISNSQLIEIRFTSSDPVKAARIASAIAATYIRAQIEAKDKASQLANEMLDRRLQDLRGRVAQAERDMERFRSEHGLFDPDGRPLDANQLQREMELARNIRAQATEARAKYEQARRMMLQGTSQETLADVMESPTIRKLREEYFKSSRREAELATKYGPRHPEMEKVRAEIARAQTELASEASKIIQSLKSSWQLAEDKSREQEAQVALLRQRIELTKDKQWRLKELEREAASSRQLYDAVLARTRQTEQTIGLQLPDARLVNEAVVPLGRSGPKRQLIALAGIAAGFALGIGLAFLLELGAGGLLRPEDVERKLKVPYLVSLPEIPISRRDTERLQLLRQMIASPQGAFAESIRTLSHEVDSRYLAQGGRVVVVTAATGGEGKTMVAANLALHYALSGQRTLLIDGDVRHAHLSNQFGAGGRPGLVEVLEGSVRPHGAILNDRTTGLNLLPAASNGRGQPGVLTLARLSGLTATLRSTFDVIVIDTPPVLSAADARLIAQIADNLVLIAAWRATPAQQIRRALKRLGATARKLDGVVLNRVDAGLHAHQIGHVPQMVVAAVRPVPARRPAPARAA